MSESSYIDRPLEDAVRESRRGRGGRRGGRSRARISRGGRRYRGFSRRKSDYRNRKPYSRRELPEGNWEHDKFENEDQNNDNDYEEKKTKRKIVVGTKLKISNLNYTVTEEDLEQLFGKVGEVISASIKYDRSGRSTGDAEVMMKNRSDAESAVKEYHNVLLDEQPMHVEILDSTIVRNNTEGITITATPYERKVYVQRSETDDDYPRRSRRGRGRRGRERGVRGRGRGRGRGRVSVREERSATIPDPDRLKAKLDNELDEYMAKSSGKTVKEPTE
jgi:THO complex subunit 4